MARKKYKDDSKEVAEYGRKRDAELTTDRKKQALIKNDQEQQKKDSGLTALFRSGVNNLIKRKDDENDGFAKIKKALKR